MATEEIPPILRSCQSIPPVIPPPLPVGNRRPGVVVAYRVWCVLFALIYLSFSINFLLVALAKVDPDMSPLEELASRGSVEARAELTAEKRAKAPGLAVVAAAVAILYGAAAAISRKPASWTLGVIVISTTIFPFVITAAGMVPILMLWCKSEVKRYFNRHA
jgi:hypothetical protein